MPNNFCELLKYAATGTASPDMTHFDKMMAVLLVGGTKPEPPADTFILNESKLDEGVIQ